MREFFAKKWVKISLIAVIAIIFLFTVFVSTTSFVLAKYYSNKIYPHIKMVNLDIGNKTKTEAKSILENQLDKIFIEAGFIFSLDGEKFKVKNEKIVEFNVDAMIENAFLFGKNDTRAINYLKRLKAFIFTQKLELDYLFNKPLLEVELHSQAGAQEKPAKDASISITIEETVGEDPNVNITIIKENTGYSFQYLAAINDLDEKIKDFKNEPVQLILLTEIPKVYYQDVEKLIPEIEELLQQKEHKIIYQDQEWKIPWQNFVHWLTIGLNLDEKPSIVFGENITKNYLSGISQQIDRPAKDAKMQIKNGRVTEFQVSETGLEVDIEKSLADMQKNFVDQKSEQAELIILETEPRVATADTNDMGITELIGVGKSNFAGSPANRRHNIGVGAATMNGLLIKPNEEFSVNKSLGPITANTGYLPELVIKGKETIPEYGGGLCQIATTMFRVAIDSGLPITERRNHSYRVVYYEPAGTDGTIYSPHPDIRFINDTEHHILIQTYIWGNNLQFEFWGTSDGREATFKGNNEVTNFDFLKPVIYNITSPGPTKIVETEELAPGEKKCIESAHNGADAYFYRYITWPKDAKKDKIEETWSSHYVPWQAVCLIGVDPAKKEKQAQEALDENSSQESEE